MASKPTDASMPFLNLGKDQTEAMLSMQKEPLTRMTKAAVPGLLVSNRKGTSGQIWPRSCRRPAPLPKPLRLISNA
jgi:hypothetical protein